MPTQAELLAARQRFVDAWNRGDREAWLSCWSDDPEIESPVGYDPPQRGLADAARRFDLGGAGRGTTIIDECCFTARDDVVVHVSNTFEVAGPAGVAS